MTEHRLSILGGLPSVKRRWLLAGFIFVFSTVAFGQESDSTDRIADPRYENWYQVELIIFERTRQSGEEAWPKNLRLTYPEKLNHLFSEKDWYEYTTALEEAELAIAAREAKEKSVFGFQNPEVMTKHDESSSGPNTSESMQVENQESARSSAKSTILQTSLSVEQTNSVVTGNDSVDQTTETSGQSLLQSDAEIQLPEMEIARLRLSAEKRTLNAAASSLDRRSAFNVLFHESWRQPLKSSAESKAIPIIGGSLVDSHYELEGWVKFSLNRFLHFETHLWHTNFELNYGQNAEGQKTEYWPEIPERPTPLVPQIEAYSSEVNDASFGFDHYLPEEKPLFSIGSVSNETSAPLSNSGLSSYKKIERSPYLIDQIVTLKQKRRMRSEELHYIDHPRLGILVRVTPYKVTMDPALAAELALRGSLQE